MYWFNLICSSLLSILASYIFVSNVSNAKNKYKFNYKKIIIILIVWASFILNAAYVKNPNRILINIFLSLVINYFVIFDKDYKKSVFYTLLFVIIGNLIEILESLVFSVVFDLAKIDYTKIKFSFVLFSIINSICTVAFSHIKPLNRKYNEIYKAAKGTKLNLFLIFVSIYVLLLCFNNSKILGNNIEFYINFGMAIFIGIASIFIVYDRIKTTQTEEKYNQMLDYVSKYEKIINEQGKRNHEFNNQLMVLEGYVDNKKKLKEYLKLLISEQKGGQNYRIKQLGYLPDGGLKGLIYYKLSKMEENNIKSFLDIGKNLENVFKDFTAEFYSDITKIFGIFIDNAIDASLLSEEKEITIEMYKDKEFLTIVISNTFSKNEDVSKIGRKGYTSKGVGHGFGLSIVKDISLRNDKIETFSDVENNIYKQTLLIDLK